MATASCRCGKVLLQFATSSPRVSTECCCDSCFLRVGFLADQRGSTCSVVNADNAVVNMKWDNRVTVVRGRDQMFAYKLTPETKVYNIASKCCHTFLLGRNDMYDSYCMTTNETEPVWGGQYQRIDPSSRWFVNQWSEERRSKLDPLMGIWVDKDGNLEGEKGWKPVFDKHLAAMNAPIQDGVVGETFDDILRSIGPVEVVSDLKKS